MIARPNGFPPHDDSGFSAPVIPQLNPRGDRKIFGFAVVVSVLLQGLLLLIDLPEPIVHQPLRPIPTAPRIIYKTRLRPPPIARPSRAPRDHRRLVPLPAAEPERLEPIREAVVAVDTSMPSAWNADVILGEAVRPPAEAMGPRTPGADVSLPVLIETSKVSPAYPEIARLGRQQGDVILQAVILADGTVGEVEVLRCDRPGVGFEAASIEAVSRWLYEPARQNGVPVDVYFTIRVAFDLR